jgi:hypothetical protein
MINGAKRASPAPAMPPVPAVIPTEAREVRAREAEEPPRKPSSRRTLRVIASEAKQSSDARFALPCPYFWIASPRFAPLIINH